MLQPCVSYNKLCLRLANQSDKPQNEISNFGLKTAKILRDIYIHI